MNALPKTDAIGRRYRLDRHPTGKRVRLTQPDLIRFNAMQTHGALPLPYIHEFTKHLSSNYRATSYHLRDLFHENNNRHGAPYLDRPPQQTRAEHYGYSHLVYDLNKISLKVLKAHDLYKEHAPTSSGWWEHDLMRSCITASLELGLTPEFAYTPHHVWVEKAGTLGCNVDFIHPNGQRHTKELRFDAVASIEYKKRGGHVFMMIQADRATEPARSLNFNRKGYVRDVLMTRHFVSSGQYRRHFKITGGAPSILLNVTTTFNNMRNWMEVVREHSPNGKNKHMLFTTLPEFGDAFKIPAEPFDLWTRPWHRVGYQDVYLNQL